MCTVEYPEGKFSGKGVVSERRMVIFNPSLVWKGCQGKQHKYRREWEMKRYGFLLEQ
jgi:hypothetical protein